jgi:hypothetical protein
MPTCVCTSVDDDVLVAGFEVEVEEEGMNNGFRVANGLECVVGK